MPIHACPLPHLDTIHLIETSHPLREQQKEKIEASLKPSGRSLHVVNPDSPTDASESTSGNSVKLSFQEWIGFVPVEKDVFTMVVAHEFFDALPINVFQKTQDGWREVYVNIDPESEDAPIRASQDSESATPLPAPSAPELNANAGKPNSNLTLALSKEASPLSQILPSTSPRFDADTPVGSRVEICKEGWEVVRMIGELIEGKVVDKDRGTGREVAEEDVPPAENEVPVGGVGVIIDYGDEKSFSNSFRVSFIIRLWATRTLFFLI